MKLTQTEYIKRYCSKSNIDEKRLNDLGLFAIPCDCQCCDGWAMVSKETVQFHIDLYLNIKDRETK